jgi:hypothetical protein
MNWWSEDDLTEGVEVSSHASPGAPRMAEAMPMAALAAAKALDDVFIVSFKAGGPRTLALRWLSDAVKTGHHARVGIVVEAAANATLLESYEGWGDAYLANHLVEIFVEEGATLERIVLIEEPASAISITSAEVHLSKGTNFAQTTIASGAQLQRLETQVVHPGEGASVRLDGLYALSGERQWNARGINRDPTASPLLGDKCGSARSASWVQHKFPRIGGHEHAALDDFGNRLDHVQLVGKKARARIGPKVVKWAQRKVIPEPQIPKTGAGDCKPPPFR